MSRLNGRAGETALPKFATGIVLVWLVLAPLIFIALAGFGVINDEILRPWQKLAVDNRLPEVVKNTFVLAICVTIGATFVGTLLALAIERTRVPWAGMMDKLILVPIMVSPLVGAVAWISLGRPETGILNMIWRTLTGSKDALFNIYSFVGVALVMVLHLLPYVYVNVRSALQNTDGSMEEAAIILGADTMYIWRRITLPLALPAILSSALMVFVLTLETFSVVGLLGGPAGFITLPFNIYLAVSLPPGDWNYAALQGFLLVMITGVLMAGYWMLIGASGKYSTVGAKGFRPAKKVGGAASRVLSGLVLAYVLMAVILPLMALALQSALAFATTRPENMVFTFDNWSTLMESAAFQKALFNTALIGGIAASAAVIICIFVAQITVFERVRSLDWLSTLPLAFPGIVLGMAMVFMYAPTPLYGTFWILALGFATQFLPFANRALSVPMMQLDRGLDESGKLLGAYMVKRVFSLTSLMIRKAVVGAWIVCFTRSIRELNIAIFLYTPATIVMPVLIWEYMEQGMQSLAAALSIVQLVLLIGIVSIMERLSQIRQGAVAQGD